MTIGATPSTNYSYEGAVGYINGYNSSATHQLSQNIGQSVQFFLITVKNSGASARNIQTLTGAGDVIDTIFRVLPQGILAYYIPNGNGGVISLVVDGVNAPTASALQTTLQALGTVNGTDVSGTTVAAGASFTVA